MYIEPNSTVILLHGVPLDNKYEHTICWDDYTTAAGKEAQYNYFNNPARRLQILTKQTYQRYDRSYIKVAIPTDNLYNCNYMMFQNTSYGNKWFYAFVTNVSYVNGNNQTGTSLIEYEIDRMQTWYFDYELMQCFVEREHSATDEVGDNIVDEGLNTGDYYYNRAYYISYNRFYYMITYQPNEDNIITWDIDQQPVTGWLGLKMKTFPADKIKPYTTQNDYLQCGLKIAIPTVADSFGDPITKLTNLSNMLTKINCNIISIQIVPSTYQLTSALRHSYLLYDYNLDSGAARYDFIPIPLVPQMTELLVSRNTVFEDYSGNSYTPKNNKLFTAPYCGVEIKTPHNDSVQLDFKYSNKYKQGIIDFKLYSNYLPEFTASIAPINYCGQPTNYNYSISLNKFPDVSFNEDSYNQWYNLNKGSIATRLVATGIRAVGMVASAYTGGTSAMVANAIATEYSNLKGRAKHKQLNKVTHVGEEHREGATKQAAIQGGVALAGDILNTLGEFSHAKNMRDSYTDNSVNPFFSYFLNDVGIGIYTMSIFPQIARIIDSYFTRFGYATKMTKIPNRRVRTHFCYTKTIGCEINGELPQSERDIICSVYDNGITFWKNPSEIGDFSIDNPPM